MESVNKRAEQILEFFDEDGKLADFENMLAVLRRGLEPIPEDQRLGVLVDCLSKDGAALFLILANYEPRVNPGAA